MSEKLVVAVVHFGGYLTQADDGSFTYTGGEAHLLDITRSMLFDQFKAEIAEMYAGDLSSLTFKYALPGNKRTLITISSDKDLRRMVDFHQDSSLEIYGLSKEVLVVNNDNNTNIVNNTNAVVSRPASTDSIIESSTPVLCVEDRPNKSVFWDNVITGVGQIFKDVNEFRDALRKYSIAKGFAYKFLKTDGARVTAKCKSEGCPWRIHASKVSTTKIFKVRTMNGEHTCNHGSGGDIQPHVTKDWVANLIKEKIRDYPDYSPSQIVNDIQRDYGVKLNYILAWRGKEAAREQVLGKDVDSYKVLPRYCEKVLETNPGSIAKVLTTDEGRFHRLFICFRACIGGFEDGCRPVICLNSTPLKLRYGGILLAATSIDGNDNVFPVAFAIVEGEQYESWLWFLELFRSALLSSRPITFVSDMMKGLREAVKEVFDDSAHAYCLFYMTEHVKRELKGSVTKPVMDVISDLIHSAARACRTDDFYNVIESIRSISPQAAVIIINTDPAQWANVFFKGSRYDQITSNVTNCFDSWLPNTSDLPVVKLVDAVRCNLVDLINEHSNEAANWETRLTPRAEEKLRGEIAVASPLSVLVSSSSVFEVLDDHSYVVDLERCVCTCYSWKNTGLPCRHAIAALNRIGRDPYDFCERYFNVECYKATYLEIPNPVLEADQMDPTPDDGTSGDMYPAVELPKTRRPPGRPKKRRVEPQVVVKRTLLCSKCKEPGHNKSTCKAIGLISYEDEMS